MQSIPPERARRSLLWLVILACAAAGFVLYPVWVPVRLAGWFAVLTRPLLKRLRFLGGRKRAAAALMAMLFLALAIPTAMPLGAAVGAAIDLVHRVQDSEGAKAALHSLEYEEQGCGEQPSLLAHDEVRASEVAG